MKRALSFFVSVAVFGPLFLSTTFSARGYAARETIASRTAEIDGVKLHYLTAGHGPALILLHGYAETSLMWKPIIPVLAARFTVIAPDLPGIGDSAIPNDGLDMKTAAIRIHALARSLGDALAQQMKLVASDVTVVVLKDTGHWVLEERPKETTEALVEFL